MVYSYNVNSPLGVSSTPVWDAMSGTAFYACWILSEFTFLTQWYAGSKCRVFLENEEDRKYFGTEHSIVIMNHKYETEFLMCWTLAERFGLLGVSTALSPAWGAPTSHPAFC